MDKLKEDFRVGILGAAAGLFSISVSLLIARVDAYYAYMSWLEKTNYQESYYAPVENLWWIPIAIWHLILSITASLVAHRHLATRLRSPFLLWQVIGTASLLGWGVTVLLVVGMEGLMSGDLYAPRHTLTSGEIADVVKYVSVGFASNVFYGSLIKASSRQYSAQSHELASEFPSNDHLLSES